MSAGSVADTGHGGDLLLSAARILVPILLALAVGGAILMLLGKDPFAYYGYIVERGLFRWSGLQASITRTAPLLLIAAGLIVAFRAGIWNLGIDGQFLLGAVLAAAVAPGLAAGLPLVVALPLAALLAFAVGALWSALPALLKVRYGINEIITTLMMSFLGISFANVLIKLAFDDPSTTVPQTVLLAVDDRLPRLFGTTIHAGVLVGLAAVILVHVMMTRTALGLKLQVVGANPKTAAHAGFKVGRLMAITFMLSGALCGLGGAIDYMGVHGTLRADWNPGYGLLVIPLVFLARFNGWAVILFVFVFAVLEIGGESAARRLGVPTYFVLVLVGLLLMFLALVEYLGHRAQVRRGR